MRLVITEKPSVARDLARVLGVHPRGDGYFAGDNLQITWCRGHLLEFAMPDAYDAAYKAWTLASLPILPDAFQLVVRKDAAAQWRIVKQRLQSKDLIDVVNACDAGREGELIFRQVYDLAKCKAPVLRFWTSSLTDDAIKTAWRQLKPSQAYDALADAARCRAESDWLVGMNATRALTCRNRDLGGGSLLSVGRVQTPTLAMIVARDRAIAAFVPEVFWRVQAQVGVDGAQWLASYVRNDADNSAVVADNDEAPHAERLASEAQAQAIAVAILGQPAEISESSRRSKRERPPLLYDLTAIQRRASQRYGMSADHTLSVAQALYEKHKLLSYPRTDSRYITQDVVETLPAILDAIAQIPAYADVVRSVRAKASSPGKRVVDDSEVGDHHAILPTARSPQASRLSPDEKRIYDLVVRRLLATISGDAVFQHAEIIAKVTQFAVPVPDDFATPVTLRARGRVCLEQGWQAVDPPSSQKDKELPRIKSGAVGQVLSAQTLEGQTRPPRPHDDGSLLGAMENAGKDLGDRELKRIMRGAGLGTPATRASIIQVLIARRYIRRDKKSLLATDEGMALIDAVTAPELCSAELTGKWELRLSRMADGDVLRDQFMQDVRAHVGRLVQDLGRGSFQHVGEREEPSQKPLGACPACGAPVRKRGKYYMCDTGRSCPFVLGLTLASRKIGVTHLRALLGPARRTPMLDGFKSKAGKPFSAALVITPEGRVGFGFSERTEVSHGEANPTQERAAVTPVGMMCPACRQGELIRGRAAWGCSRWRENCTWKLSYCDANGNELTHEDACNRVMRATDAYGASHHELSSDK